MFVSQIWTLSIESLLMKINYKLEPGENDWIGRATEELLRRSSAPAWFGAKNRDKIVRFGGIASILKLVSLWENDESLPALLLKLLLKLAKVKGSSEEILNNGGKSIFMRIIEIHKEDYEIRVDVRKLLNKLSIIEKKIALKELEHARDGIKYGIPISLIRKYQCRHTGRNHNSFCDNQQELIRESISPIQKLVEIMNGNIKNDLIQEIGLESIIPLAKDPLQSKIFCDEGGIQMLADVMLEHKSLLKIQWRGCTIIRNLCSNNLETCSNIAKQGICKTIMDVYMDSSSILELKQQALWTISCLCHLDYFMIELENFGFHLLLHELLSPSKVIDTQLIVPLKLRQLYFSESKDRIHSDQSFNSTSRKPKETGIDITQTYQVAYGTVDDTFEEGEPGLI